MIPALYFLIGALYAAAGTVSVLHSPERPKGKGEWFAFSWMVLGFALLWPIFLTIGAMSED